MATWTPATRWLVLGLVLAAVLLALVVVAALNPPRPAPYTLRHFPEDYIARARAYTTPAYLLFAGSRAAQLAVLAFLALTLAGQRWLGAVAARAGERPLLAVAAAVLAVLVAVTLARLPFAFYRGFIHEHRFGLSNQTLGLWAADFLKTWGISAALTVGAALVLAWLIRAAPGGWWWQAGIVLSAGMVLLTTLAPVAIDPLFHRFRPLDDAELRERLVVMARQAGLHVDEVLVADASRRTERVNAYFTGVGPTQRIVLFDTLLAKHPRDEVELVVAHELAHWARRHIQKGLALGIGGLFLGLFLLNRLLAGEAAARGWAWADPRLVATALLAVALAGLLAMPVSNAISRGWEREADALAIALSQQAETAVRVDRRLAMLNLSDPQPHPWLVALLFTHPPQIERIRAAEAAAD